MPRLLALPSLRRAVTSKRKSAGGCGMYGKGGMVERVQMGHSSINGA